MKNARLGLSDASKGVLESMRVFADVAISSVRSAVKARRDGAPKDAARHLEVAETAMAELRKLLVSGEVS